MAISSDKLYTIINIVYDNSKNTSSIEDICELLQQQNLLPKKLSKNHLNNHKFNSLFVSKQAEELASKYNLVLEPGTGTARNGKFSVADIQKIYNASKINISPSAKLKVQELGIPISQLNIKGHGQNGKIILSDVKTLEKVHNVELNPVNDVEDESDYD